MKPTSVAFERKSITKPNLFGSSKATFNHKILPTKYTNQFSLQVAVFKLNLKKYITENKRTKLK